MAVLRAVALDATPSLRWRPLKTPKAPVHNRLALRSYSKMELVVISGEQRNVNLIAVTNAGHNAVARPDLAAHGLERLLYPCVVEPRPSRPRPGLYYLSQRPLVRYPANSPVKSLSAQWV
jgi:hypothetical protein